MARRSLHIPSPEEETLQREFDTFLARENAAKEFVEILGLNMVLAPADTLGGIMGGLEAIGGPRFDIEGEGAGAGLRDVGAMERFGRGFERGTGAVPGGATLGAERDRLTEDLLSRGVPQGLLFAGDLATPDPSDVVPMGAMIPSLMRLLRRAPKVAPGEETGEAFDRLAKILEREEIDDPEIIAQLIEDARAGRIRTEEVAGGIIGEGEADSLALEQLGDLGLAEGDVTDRLVEDLLEGQTPEMLRSGELTPAPTRPIDIESALPRERPRLSPDDIIDAEAESATRRIRGAREARGDRESGERTMRAQSPDRPSSIPPQPRTPVDEDALDLSTMFDAVDTVHTTDDIALHIDNIQSDIQSYFDGNVDMSHRLVVSDLIDAVENRQVSYDYARALIGWAEQDSSGMLSGQQEALEQALDSRLARRTRQQVVREGAPNSVTREAFMRAFGPGESHEAGSSLDAHNRVVRRVNTTGSIEASSHLTPSVIIRNRRDLLRNILDSPRADSTLDVLGRMDDALESVNSPRIQEQMGDFLAHLVNTGEMNPEDVINIIHPDETILQGQYFRAVRPEFRVE